MDYLARALAILATAVAVTSAVVSLVSKMTESSRERWYMHWAHTDFGRRFMDALHEDWWNRRNKP